MYAPCIRMDYDEGRVCEACFSETAEGIQSLRSSLARCLNLLQEGAWTGQGAGAFYAEMNSEVLPAVDRLGQALREACRAMATIGAHFQEAEREAGALFIGAEDEGYGGGQSDSVSVGAAEAQLNDAEMRRRELESRLREYGITLEGNWSLRELEMLLVAVERAATRLHNFATETYMEDGIPFTHTPEEVFERIFGSLTFVRGNGDTSA